MRTLGSQKCALPPGEKFSVPFGYRYCVSSVPSQAVHVALRTAGQPGQDALKGYALWQPASRRRVRHEVRGSWQACNARHAPTTQRAVGRHGAWLLGTGSSCQQEGTKTARHDAGESRDHPFLPLVQLYCVSSMLSGRPRGPAQFVWPVWPRREGVQHDKVVLGSNDTSIFPREPTDTSIEARARGGRCARAGAR